MSHPRSSTAVLLGALALAAPGAWSQAPQTYPQERQGVEVRERFEGTLPPAGPREGPLGSPRPVSLRNWAVRGGQRVEIGDRATFRVVQLLAGEATTVSEGRRVERREGEFWAIPAGATMTVETEDDTALLQVFAVGGG